MKSQQQDEAKELYFQTDLSKTEIAQKVGVDRKTILFWAHRGNWDKLRLSARNMPAIVAEKCYYLIDQYTNSLLQDGSSTTMSSFQLRHAQTIHLLAASIKKLKNRSTVNESMEMFSFFLNGLSRRDPALAEQVAPEIEDYIQKRRKVETTDFLFEDFNPDGTLPFPEKEYTERWTDTKEGREIMDEYEEFLNTRAAAKPQTPATPEQETPTTATETPDPSSEPIITPGHPHLTQAA